uniref:hypothetical protein n=1 Tax=Ulva meridionalis TaxID=434723 RepID=UPI0021155EDC|nr:hypothetical protein NQY40_mgp33 [Ulva meridionalis]UTA96523.1 hypothetical protein [Ulva meridionalis]UTA96581.1 hypothetical protein [Ulva meridionalis]UTA96634.1 hypothetical protein [Ulva meridionalis]UTA96686.1 hypothetical protein [Ulva meridionalis]UTA96749.1 hypothetical protein [Ulva meridionalis]
MIYFHDILEWTNFSSLILIKLITSFTYLVINYITHKIELPVMLANLLRLLISGFDLVILLILILGYVFEGCAMAYSFSILGILFFIYMCFASWLTLVQNNSVQSIFIINVFSLIVLLILQIQFVSMGLAYSKGLAALLIFNGVYTSCWLFFNPYAKIITSFMGRIGQKCSWVDPLIGNIPRKDLAFRNVCSFSLGLLNLTYIHTSGEVTSIITFVLIGLGLLTNVLIGFRLIDASASVKLHHGFMVQIIINGYSNIITIYDQLKNNKLPKAGWYAWMIALIMGLNSTSSSYCISSIDGPIIDASLTGEQFYERDNEEASPTAESRELFRCASRGIELASQYAQRQAAAASEADYTGRAREAAYEVVKSAAAGSIVAGIGYSASEIVGLEEGSSAAPEKAQIEKLEAEIAEKNSLIAAKDKIIEDQQKTISQQQETISTLQKKSTWKNWFNCLKKDQVK